MIHAAALLAAAMLQTQSDAPLQANTQEPTQERATIEDLAFLTGNWRGESQGSIIEECWLPPTEGNLTGVFRMSGNGEVQLVEIMTLSEEDDGLVYRLRHFNTALVPWASEVDGPMQSTSVVVVDEDSVRFEFDEASGVEVISYDRQGDAMTARVVFPESAEREAFVLVFERVD